MASYLIVGYLEDIYLESMTVNLFLVCFGKYSLVSMTSNLFLGVV